MKKAAILVVLLALGLFSKGADDTIGKYLNKIRIADPIEYENLRILSIQ